MQANHTETPAFPDDLSAVPEAARVAQAFGWALACWGIGLIIFSSLVLTQPAKPSQGEYIGAAASFLAGMVMLAWEFRRRGNPRVLARFPQFNLIGIYKRGKLNRVVDVEQVNLVLYHPGRTWGPILALSLSAIAFAALLLPGAIAISRTNRVYIALASLLFAAFTASVIKTRLRCDTCMLPYENKRGSEWVLVRRKDLPHLLSRVPRTEKE